MKEKVYRTPLGVDEKVIDYPAKFTDEQVRELKKMGVYFINWHGWTLAMGTGMTVEIFNDIRARLRQIRSVVIVITGRPGEGKTWFAMRLAQIFDSRFDVRKQLCFTREHVAKIISGEVKLRPGQAVIIDEAHFTTGARHSMERMQKEIVDEIATIRSRGLMVIIVVLHISMLDKILRNFVLTYQFHMEERGLAAVYEIFTPRFEYKVYHPGRGKVSLQVPWYEVCPSPDCLKCPMLQSCGCQRAMYERLKRKFVEEVGRRTLRKSEKKSVMTMSTKEKLEIIYKNRDKLTFRKSGKIDPVSIQLIFQEIGLEMGYGMAETLARMVPIKYPEIAEMAKKR